MRRKPVAFLLFDAAFLADPKWRALRRRLPEPRDFNSAVGAYLIVLAAARRNGEPGLNMIEEAEDGSYLEDLIHVGLLCDTGLPAKAFQSWAPARPKYPSDSSAPDVPSAPDATNTPPRESSTHIPSTPIKSTYVLEGGAGGNAPDAAVSYERRTGRWPSERIVAWLSDMAKRAGGGDALAGEPRVAGAIDRTPFKDMTPKEYLERIDALLRREDHDATRRELEDEAGRLAEKRAPLPDNPVTTMIRETILSKYDQPQGRIGK